MNNPGYKFISEAIMIRFNQALFNFQIFRGKSIRYSQL